VDSVVWNFDDTPSGESNTSLLNNPCHVFSFPGIYNVEALIYNGGASSIYFESITVTEPVLAIMSGGDSVCIGELFMDAQIIASGIGPFNVDYSNGFSNFTLIGESPFDINIIQGGVYTITSILGANNCQGVVMGEATYVTISYPTADFHIESNEIFIDETDIIFENYSLDNSSSNWSFGDGYFSQDNAPFINHIYNDVETYHIELIVQNEFGCADTTAQSLIVKPIQYFLPNAFTPNDQNNINDSFGLLSDKVQSFDMMIFDRWGVMVYETDEIVSPWDGTVNGVDAQSGVYNYKILVEDPLGIIHKLSGSVSLIK
jgi:gliding motility-associated-like protein